MYRVDQNNFYQREKRATVLTPESVSQFIYQIVEGKIDRNKPVLDPCVGKGSLLKPFKAKGYEVIGIDIEDQGFPGTKVQNYLSVKKGKSIHPCALLRPAFAPQNMATKSP